MLSREGKQTDRGAVGAEFIGYNRRRREALLLQEFPHQPNCRPSVPAGLNQEIQDFALTVHGTPEIELPPSNYDDHLVQVPAFGRSWPPTLNPPRIGPTEFQDPSSNCLIRDVETTLGKQVLNVPIAQRETAIEPDGMLDDDRWKAVTTVGYLAHPETLKHRPCRSHAVNVTMPAGGVLHGNYRLHHGRFFCRHVDGRAFCGARGRRRWPHSRLRRFCFRNVRCRPRPRPAHRPYHLVRAACRCRVLYGAGMVMVVESWVNERATNKTRGRVLSLYMITNYLGAGLGLFMMLVGDPAQFQLFIVASLPIRLTHTPTRDRFCVYNG